MYNYTVTRPPKNKVDQNYHLKNMKTEISTKTITEIEMKTENINIKAI